MLSFNELPEPNSERWLLLKDLPGEMWKPVCGYESFLFVSNYGRVLKEPRPHSSKRLILKQRLSNKGCWMVTMTVCRRNVRLNVHRLVALSFIDNPDNKPAVDHIDTNKLNNMVGNLRWVTHSENQHNPLTRAHMSNALKGVLSGHHKMVAKMDKAGNVLCVYSSVLDASLDTGINYRTICDAAKNALIKDKRGWYRTRSAGGYKWKYIE